MMIYHIAMLVYQSVILFNTKQILDHRLRPFTTNGPLFRHPISSQVLCPASVARRDAWQGAFKLVAMMAIEWANVSQVSFIMVNRYSA